MAISKRLQLCSLAIWLSAVGLCLAPGEKLFAQAPPEPDAGTDAGPALLLAQNEPEPLLRGPVHEAFADPYVADPQPGLIAPKQPPAEIEELPPDSRPEGANVQWIPGYWGWDEEREDFIWISGIWRSAPPNHRWVPGYWYLAETGYQWVAGTWIREAAEEIEYLAQAPPESLDLGPVGDPPGESHIWIPGCWTWGGTNYLWRPGYWSMGYNNWIWVPARYYWTPYGYAFRRGYWDYPFVNRGYLFAPYFFPQPSYLAAGFVFTPGISLSVGLLTNNFWVSARYGHYFFGDYYGNFGRFGFQPWHRHHFARRGFDPLFAHYQRNFHRDGRGGDWWRDRDGRSGYYDHVNRGFQERVNNQDRRPPRTWSEQVARYGRGENGGRDFDFRDGDRGGPGNRGPGDRGPGTGSRGSDSDRLENALGRNWRDITEGGSRGEAGNRGAGDRAGSTSFTRLSDAQREQYRQNANNFRQLSDQRRSTESNREGGNRGPGASGPGAGAQGGGGNRVVEGSGSGVQNRFRLPDATGANRGGSTTPGQAGNGPRPTFDRSRGTGDISTTMRSQREAIERAGGRVGNPAGGTSTDSSRSGTPTRSQFGQGRPTPGVTTNPGASGRSSSESAQSAIDRARRSIDGGASNRPGGSGPATTRPGGSGPATTRPGGSGPATTGPSSSNNPSRAFNPPGGSGVGGNRSSTPPSNSGTRSTTPPSGGTRSFTPPSNSGQGTTRAFTPPSNSGSGTTRAFTPPSNSGSGTTRSFTPPSNSGSGATRSFTPPSGGTRATTPPSNSGARTFTPPSNSGSGTTRSFAPPSNSGSGATRSFAPPSGGTRATTPPSNSGARSFAPPSNSGSGSTRSFSPPSGNMGSSPTFRSGGGPSNSGPSFRGGGGGFQGPSGGGPSRGRSGR